MEAGLPRLGGAMGYPDSTGCALTWEMGLVGSRFPQLPPLIRALLGSSIVFTAVQLLLFSEGTDRPTLSYGVENNIQAKTEYMK